MVLDLADGRQMSTVEYAAELGVRLVLGYEFSCDTWVDDVHICGYGLDWNHPDVLAEVAAAERSKSRAYEELCERLTEAGMPLDWERDILHYTGPDGQPAVARSGGGAAEAHLRGDGRQGLRADLERRQDPGAGQSRA